MTALKVSFTCPFCRLEAGVTLENFLMHRMPMCSEFLNLAPDQYLAAVNRKLRTH